MMYRLPILWCVCLQAVCVSLPAADYFVAKDGDDANAGSFAAPYATIGKAVERLEPGDNLYIKEGVYRESVTLNRSGRADKPITIQAYGLDQVEISGVEGVKAEWTLHDAAKGIYSIGLDAKVLNEEIVRDSFQVFVDRKSLVPARWPNCSYDELLTRKGWQEGGRDARFGYFYVPELVGSELDLEGVDIYLNIIHQFFTWKRQVTAFDPETGRLDYPKDMVIAPHFFKKDTYWERQGWSNDYFYLEGSYGLLDYPGEFFYDAEAGKLFLIPPDGVDPNEALVEVKTRLYGMQGNGLDHVKIEGINFFGCTFSFEGADGLVLKNITALYTISQTNLREVRNANDWEEVQTAVRGRRNLLEDVYIAYATLNGLSFWGTGNVLDNSIIHDSGYSGSLIYKCLAMGGESIARQSTIFNSGNVGIHFVGPNFLLELNHVYNNGLLSNDVSSIYTAGDRAKRSRVTHNWVHDNPSPTGSIGIRGDDLTRGLTVDHNVVWNTTVGITVKGDDNSVFNNTVFNAERWDILMEKQPEPRKEFQVEAAEKFLDAQNQNTFYYNNLVNDETSVKHGPTVDPIPIEKRGSGFIYDSDPPLVDVEALDFRPLESYRKELTGKPLPTETVIPVSLDPASDPYIGAYGFDGDYWKPGAIHGIRYQLIEEDGRSMLRFKYSLPLLAEDTLTVTVNREFPITATVSKEQSFRSFTIPISAFKGENTVTFGSKLFGEISVEASIEDAKTVFMQRFAEPSYIR